MVSKAKRRGKAKRKVKLRNAKSRKAGRRAVTGKAQVKAKRPPGEKAETGKQAKVYPLFAVIRVRGPVNVKKGVEDTLDMLRLGRVNHCILAPGNPSYSGMLQKANGYLTWGEISQQTLEKLIFKRGSFEGKSPTKARAGEIAKKMISASAGSDELRKEELKLKLKPVFRLSPPSKGYRSVRISYPKGDLGYRGEKINELLKRMV